MDLFKEFRDQAEELKKSRAESFDFFQQYMKYVLNEIKSAEREEDIFLIESPKTRRKKLDKSVRRDEDCQEEIEAAGNVQDKVTSSSSTSSRKGRAAAKKALEGIAAGNKLLSATKLRRPTEVKERPYGKRKKSLPDDDDEDEVEVAVLDDNETENTSPMEVDDQDGTLKDSENAENSAKIDEAQDQDSTLTSSGTDMFGPAPNVQNNDPVPNDIACETVDKLKMKPVIVLERLTLKNEEHGNDNKIDENKRDIDLTKNNENKENNEPCFSRNITKEKTFILKENNEKTSSIILKVGDSVTNSISNEKTIQVLEPAASTSSKEIAENCEIVNEIKVNEEMEIETPQSENSSADKPPVKSIRRENTNSELQTRGRSRTRVKDTLTDQEATKINVTPMVNSCHSVVTSSEKKALLKSNLPVRNRMLSPAFGSAVKVPKVVVANKMAALEAEKKRKEEEMRKRMQKEEEAQRNREEMIKAKQEELKRKREFKTQKVVATRVAVEKEKSANLAKIEKEKEERERIKRMEMEKAREEQLKKKLLHQQKLQEAEERRIREENLRLQRLKEQEEEQKRLAEIKQKQQEEAEKLALQRRLCEEGTKKEEHKNQKQVVPPKVIKNNKSADINCYDITPQKIEPEPLEDEENYGVHDLKLDDSEDESHPRKVLPKWARKAERKVTLTTQCFIPQSNIQAYFICPSKTPNLKEFFGKYTRERARTSSAVWNTPPRPITH